MRKHLFNERITYRKRKNDADQLVKERERVIFIEDFHPLGFGFIVAELIVRNLREEH